MISYHKQPFFGFGWLILSSYLILVLCFALKGFSFGLLTFLVANILGLVFHFILLAPDNSLSQTISLCKDGVLNYFTYCTLISGLTAGFITSFWKRTKTAIILGIILFLILVIICALIRQ